MKKIRFALWGVVLAMLASCSDYTAVQKTSDYGYKYEAAKQYYAEGQYNRAAVLLQDLIAVLKGTEKGEESLFLLGMSSFQARNYEAAVPVFKKYYQSYPRGTYAEDAHFYCGLALYESTPEARLDQTETYEAITEFHNFLEEYPYTRFRNRAQDLIFAMQDKLVEKEYLTAKLYYDLGAYFGNSTIGGSNYQACIVTAENAINDYPYTTRREDFAMLILKAKFDLAEQSIEEKKEERYHSAIDEYYGFVNEYPESKYQKAAAALFAKAKAYVKTSDEQ